MDMNCIVKQVHTIVLTTDGVVRYYPCDNQYDALVLFDMIIGSNRKYYTVYHVFDGRILRESEYNKI